MAALLLICIRFYWLVPERWRRNCIFKDTCSQHVYKTAKEQGFLKGVHAFMVRVRQCRPGYSIYITDDKTEWVILKDNTVIERGMTNV